MHNMELKKKILYRENWVASHAENLVLFKIGFCVTCYVYFQIDEKSEGRN